ncbi:hypothetical protein R5W24_005170 [Gemmata sp. JC717]|uniref:hypothetical protein n=1 Tax=Gemmata algarum TaxID=2975278 RepID=UPI0021BAC35C|nr:hypothetical protein [Gemmata algarum]MDY3556007.1 hypothetical protein [Gemmata algarum]
MRNTLFAALALAFSAEASAAPPPKYEASVRADRDRIKLWEPVQVTLTVDGPAPMRTAVELPKQLLTDATNGDWRIRPKGDAELLPLPDGRERWTQTFRLDPHAPGKPLRAELAPVGVNGKPLTQTLAVEVTVERTGGDDTPLPESLPVTTIEELPPQPGTSADRSPGTVLVAAAVAAVCAMLLVFVWRRVRRPKSVPPGAWARTALAALEAEYVGGPDFAERLASVLRRYVERRFAIPATRLTTAELYEATTLGGWPVDGARVLRGLLDECDLAKFAGTAPDVEGCAKLIGAARDWLDRTDPEPGA